MAGGQNHSLSCPTLRSRQCLRMHNDSKFKCIRPNWWNCNRTKHVTQILVPRPGHNRTWNGHIWSSVSYMHTLASSTTWPPSLFQQSCVRYCMSLWYPTAKFMLYFTSISCSRQRVMLHYQFCKGPYNPKCTRVMEVSCESCDHGFWSSKLENALTYVAPQHEVKVLRVCPWLSVSACQQHGQGGSKSKKNNGQSSAVACVVAHWICESEGWVKAE